MSDRLMWGKAEPVERETRREREGEREAVGFAGL